MNVAPPDDAFPPWATDPPPTLGAALGQIVDAIAREHGDRFMDRLGALAPGERAIAVLEYVTRTTYAEGLQAVYTTAIDDLGEEVKRAARQVGAMAYADLFRRANEALPADVRQDRTRRETYLLDNPAALDRYEDEFYALEDAGDVLVVHAVRYVETHPGEFRI